MRRGKRIAMAACPIVSKPCFRCSRSQLLKFLMLAFQAQLSRRDFEKREPTIANVTPLLPRDEFSMKSQD